MTSTTSHTVCHTDKTITSNCDMRVKKRPSSRMLATHGSSSAPKQ